MFVSLFPMYLCVVLATVYPNLIGRELGLIEDIFGLFGMVIYNYNGFIIPFLIKRKLNIEQKKGCLSKFFNYFMLCFFVISGALGIGNEFYEKLK